VKNKKNTYSNISQLVKTPLFGIGMTNATTKEILEYLFTDIKKTLKNIYIVTPNPEILLFANAHESFKSILNGADLALCDGMQLFRAAKLVGKPLKERIIGTNFMESLCEETVDWPITVGFLGGGQGVAEKTAECLIGKYPKLKVAFVGEEWSEGGFAKGQSSVDILFVAFGFPKQERWMAEHLNKIPVRVLIGVGGAFDQIITPSLRPPAWVHSIGMGWLYRLVREPWRITRQIKLVEFVWLVVKEKMQNTIY
jgi:N-acetylglucosaminyldiphosphoundecaprenol N-acetyl-beta-D-mannosaminyltransferase